MRHIGEPHSGALGRSKLEPKQGLEPCPTGGLEQPIPRVGRMERNLRRAAKSIHKKGG